MKVYNKEAIQKNIDSINEDYLNDNPKKGYELTGEKPITIIKERKIKGF